MTATSSLADRIDAVFAAAAERIKQFQTAQIQEHHERQQRLEKLDQLFDELRDLVEPRLQTLAHGSATASR